MGAVYTDPIHDVLSGQSVANQRLFHMLYIETDAAVLNRLGREMPFPMGRVSDSARTVTVALPGRQPEVSGMQLTQRRLARIE
jgi:hypothetical protein